jgi:hypothetical protein
VLGALDDPSAISILKQMAVTDVSSVEPLCVEEVQAVHPSREMFALGFDDQVIVIRHQAIGEEVPGKSSNDVSDLRSEGDVVEDVACDRGPSYASGCDVVDPIG